MKPLFPRLTAAALLALLAGAAPAASNAPIELTFADFFASPIGPRGLEPTPALQAAVKGVVAPADASGARRPRPPQR